MIRDEKWWLWLEWIGLFVLLPIILQLSSVRRASFPVLFLATGGMVLWLVRGAKWRRAQFWRGDCVFIERQQLRRILLRFVLCAVALCVAVIILAPDRLLQLPLNRPQVWLGVLVLYPLLSVYPQELVYRAFFFRRYERLFATPCMMITASACAFGWVHLLFRNPLAVVLTLAGGLLFAETYARTHSLRLVCLEHALYGSLIFTIGLGQFFFLGRAG